MSLLQQLIGYLSQPPDSTVYHIVTLLALQATLGVAWWQARRNPSDHFAQRLAWASGTILLSRLFILLALFATSGLVEAIVLLPPLERAVDALSVAVLVWALGPRPKGLPRLGSALLLIVVIVIAFLYITYASEWRELIAGNLPEVSFANTEQATVWSILQLALLVAGIGLVLYARQSQWSLRAAILGVLLIAQGLSLILGNRYSPPNVEVSVWSRLGNVIVFPMLAILAYRHNLRRLLPANVMDRTVVDRLVQTLNLAGEVSGTLQPEKTLEAALKTVPDLLPVSLVALVQINDHRPQHLDITATTREAVESAQEGELSVRRWRMRRDDQATFSRIMSDRKQVELLSDGPGARQYHELQQDLKLNQQGALLIQPLVADESEIGLLILASGPSTVVWSNDDKVIAGALGSFLSDALNNARRYQLALAGQAPDFDRELAKVRAELDQVACQRDEALSQVNQLHEQVTQLGDQLTIARERLNADERKLRETTQALALAAQRQRKVGQLETELAGLREALSEAELALAYAAAGEAGLSTEWVMRTVTRYSGELEEAQAQISALEERLRQPDGQKLLERAAAITGQLRTPLTALGGYTDLMLERATGELSPQQESILQRMRINVDNMATTVDSLSATARSAPSSQPGEALINIHEALEEAIYAVSPQLQAKKLRIDVYVEDHLPSLEDPTNSVNELLVKLLSAASLVALPDGRLQVSARQLRYTGRNGGDGDLAGFLRISISDDGGAQSHAIYGRTIVEQRPPAGDSSSDKLPELVQYLNSASLLAASRGGRNWLDLAHPRGSTLTLLLPLPAAAPNSSG